MNKKKNLEYILKGKDIFSDNRGRIENFKLPEKINLVAIITSLSSCTGTKMFVNQRQIYKYI